MTSSESCFVLFRHVNRLDIENMGLVLVRSPTGGLWRITEAGGGYVYDKSRGPLFGGVQDGVELSPTSINGDTFGFDQGLEYSNTHFSLRGALRLLGGPWVAIAALLPIEIGGSL